MKENIKIKVNYIVNKNIINEFNKLTKSKAINKSGLIELLIQEWIKNNNYEANK